MWMEMSSSLLFSCTIRAEGGLGRLRCGKTSRFELLQGLQQYSSYLALLSGRFPRALRRG